MKKNVINFDFECDLFNMTMKHRAVEEFYMYVGLVRITSDEYNDTTRIGFEYKKDWRAEWVKYIVEKYCLDGERDEQIISKVEKYFNDNTPAFIDDFSILYTIKEYAKENRFLIETRWQSYDITPDIYLTGKLDRSNDIHRIVSFIAEYADAYRNAMECGVVEYRFDVHIPVKRLVDNALTSVVRTLTDKDLTTIRENELVIKRLVCSWGKMIDDIEFENDEIVVYIDR